MAENDIFVSIGLDISKYVQGVASIARSNASVERSVANVNRTMAKMGDKATKQQTQLATEINKTARAFANVPEKQAKALNSFLRGAAQYTNSQANLVRAQNAVQLSNNAVIISQNRLLAIGARVPGLLNQIGGAAGGAGANLRGLGAAAGGAGGGGGLGGLGGALSSAAGSFKSFGSAALNVTKILGAPFIGAIKGAWSLLQKFGSALATPFQKLGSFFNRVAAVASGVLIRDVIFGISRAIKEMSDQVVQAAADFQTLEVRFATLAARSIRLKDASVSITNAFDQAGIQAQQLLEWVKQLSLTVPFDVKNIGDVAAFSMAMGFAGDTVQRLTTDVLTYTAAMGLGSEVTERIILNFGQMKQQGKITSTEMRDLARGAFFPLDLVLAEVAKNSEYAGKSIIEIKKAASEGKIPVEEFFNAFMTVTERDFSGSLERLAATFTGLKTIIVNWIKTIVGGDILGPVVRYIGTSIYKALQGIDVEQLRVKAIALGQVLLAAFKVIIAAIKNNLIPAFEALFSAFGFGRPSAEGFAFTLGKIAYGAEKAIMALSALVKFIAGILQKAFTAISTQANAWGFNIVESLANGMAIAVTLIVKVINAIANIIAGLLRAGSPPKVLPHLTEWGTAAMESWLEGWTKADFSFFNDIADKVEAFLRSIPGGIGANNKGLIPLILGTRETLVKAIEDFRNGFITVQQAISRVMAKAGRLPSSFRAYISAMFAVEEAEKRVAEASKLVEAAQARVNEITTRYDAILKGLNAQLTQVTDVYDDQKRLQKINEALATNLLTAEERERLEAEKRAILIKQQIRDTEAQRDQELSVAEQALAAREAEMAAAEANLQMLQDQLAAAEALIDFQIKQNSLYNEQMELLKQLAAAAKAAAEAAAAAGEDVGGDLGLGAGVNIPNVQETIDRFLQIMNRARGEIDTMWEGMFGKNGTVTKVWDGLFGENGTLTGDLNNIRAKFGEIMPIIVADMLTFSTITGMAFSAFGEENQENVKKMGDALASLGLGDINVNLLLLATLLSPIFLVLAIGSGIMGGLASAVEAVAAPFNNLTKILGPDDGSLLWTIRLVFGTILGIIIAPFNFIIGFISGFIESVVGFFQNLYDRLVGNSIIPDLVNTITSLWTGMIDSISEAINGFINNVLTLFNDYIATPLTNTVNAFKTGPLTTLTNFVNTTATEAWNKYFKPALQAVSDFFSGLFTTVVNTFKNTTLSGLITYIQDTATSAIDTFRTKVLDPLKDAFNRIVDAVKSAWQWVTDLIGALRTLDISKILKLLGIGGRQAGGPVMQGQKYLVGEKGREMFVPFTNGFVFPNWLTERIMSAGSSSVKTINYITNIEVNPTYKNYASEADVYYDITAALSAARM